MLDCVDFVKLSSHRDPKMNQDMRIEQLDEQSEAVGKKNQELFELGPSVAIVT